MDVNAITQPNTPATRRAEVTSMIERSQVCRDVCFGRYGMIAAGQKYLPKFPLEDLEEWKARLASTFFFDAFERSISTMVGKVLAEPIARENLGPDQNAWFENIDLAGSDLETWSTDVLTAILCDGITWAVVSYPEVPAGLSKAQEAEYNSRPYFIHVPLENVISWRTHNQNGRMVLDEFRYSEAVEGFDGWVVTSQKKIRVLRIGETGLLERLVYAQDASKKWIPEGEPVISQIKEVPVVCFYGKKTGYFCGLPPLETLAWKNVEHWQSSSEQRSILHVSRVALKFGKCLDMNDDGTLKLSNSTIISTSNPNGDFKYVEHGGAAIEAGDKDIANIEDQMRRLAGEMLVAEGGQKTAKEATLESQEGGSRLKGIVKRFEDSLEECLRLMGVWTNQTITGTLAVNDDWDDAALGADVITALTTSRQSGNMSQEAYYFNMKRGGFYPEGWTLEQEQESLSSEGPKLMSSFPTTK